MPERLLYKGTHKIPEILDDKDINVILNQILISGKYLNNDWGKFMRYRDITIISTIYILGLRPKEACCLRFDDFNLRNSTVKIRGENNKVRKDRVLPLPKILIEILNIYFQFPRHRFWKGSKYLFPSFKNNHISPERLKHIFREKCLKPLRLWQMPTKSKIPKIRLYTLRHSRASHILRRQIQKNGQPDIYLLSNILGHSDIRSTIVYLHTDEEYQKYMRENLEI